jgi:hypothetical protein
MTRRKHPRVWAPISVGIMGSAIVVAVGVSRGWGAAIGVAVAVFVIAAFFYLVGGSDSDAGAVFGNRADERQALVALKAQALALRVMVLGALVGWAIAIALKGLYWPFDLIFSAGGITFWIGLGIYGVREDSPIGSTDALQDPASDPHNLMNG